MMSEQESSQNEALRRNKQRCEILDIASGTTLEDAQNWERAIEPDFEEEENGFAISSSQNRPSHEPQRRLILCDDPGCLLLGEKQDLTVG